MRRTLAARGFLWLAALAAGVLLWAGQAAALPPGFQENNGLLRARAADGNSLRLGRPGLRRREERPRQALPRALGHDSDHVRGLADERPQLLGSGLLRLALDPNFPADPYVYVLYTHDAAIGGVAPRWGSMSGTSDGCPAPPGATADGCVVSGRLSRLTASGDAAIAENVLMKDWCQQYPSHSIGALEFGADGALYVSAGDGASFNFTDYGQDGSPVNPCGDPPGAPGTTLSPPTAEGGALRSQDLRTSGDPVTLDGSILRVDPDSEGGASIEPALLEQRPERPPHRRPRASEPVPVHRSPRHQRGLDR